MRSAFLLFFMGLFANDAFANEKLEPLMGHFATQGGVQIQVYSGGCTWKKHFYFNQENREGRIRITFHRKQEDPCRAYIPYGEILTFSFDELGLKAGDVFEIANPDAPTRVSRH